MRVATFNIRHGAPPGRWADHRAMARAVAGLRADVVALQEVDRRVVRSWFVDQARAAARRSGAEAHFAAARPCGPGGRYGNALVVRGTTLRTQHMRLPGPGEARVALFADVVVADRRLSVVATHLQNRRSGAVSQAPGQLEAVLHELTAWPEPWCLAGDLNLRADTVEPMLAAAGLVPVRSGPTFPAHEPKVRIDWIATRGLGVGHAEVPDVRTSDHRPLVASFTTVPVAAIPHGPTAAADPSPDDRLRG
jgi:endonuclease/exonuclease/phosphatase family metal-dependent hydrolase